MVGAILIFCWISSLKPLTTFLPNNYFPGTSFLKIFLITLPNKFICWHNLQQLEYFKYALHSSKSWRIILCIEKSKIMGPLTTICRFHFFPTISSPPHYVQVQLFNNVYPTTNWKCSFPFLYNSTQQILELF
jgi:hypothetical protein